MTKCDLIDQLLQDLAEYIQTGTDDEGRPAKYFTLGARNKVEVFIDRLNDLPVQVLEISTWLAEEAKKTGQEGIRLSITSDVLKPFTASFFPTPSLCLVGFGKTPSGAVSDAYNPAISIK